MLHLATIVSAPPALPAAGLYVVALRDLHHRLESRRVATDPEGGFRLQVPTSFDFPASATFPGSHKLSVSPDGTTVACVVEVGGERRIRLFRGATLRPLRSIPAPKALSLVWSPSGRQIAFLTESRNVGVAEIDGTRSPRLLPEAISLVWSRNGNVLFLGNATLRPLASPAAKWTRHDLAAGTSRAATSRQVAAESWLGKIPSKRRASIDVTPHPSWKWAPQGLFAPFYELQEHDRRPVAEFDLLVRAKGASSIRRESTGFSGICLPFWPGGNRVYYLQSLRLFGTKAAANPDLWFGAVDLAKGTSEQAILRNGNTFDTFELAMVRG